MDEQTATRDLYEAVWYYLNGCRIETIQCLEVAAKKPQCFFTFHGANVTALQLAYVRQEATVNVWQFRKAYAELTDLVADAKKRYRLGGAS